MFVRCTVCSEELHVTMQSGDLFFVSPCPKCLERAEDRGKAMGRLTRKEQRIAQKFDAIVDKARYKIAGP